ncbi:hypothetical protein JKP88DRAFT_234949, partial [Tribonema minus]
LQRRLLHPYSGCTGFLEAVLLIWCAVTTQCCTVLPKGEHLATAYDLLSALRCTAPHQHIAILHGKCSLSTGAGTWSSQQASAFRDGCI